MNAIRLVAFLLVPATLAGTTAPPRLPYVPELTAEMAKKAMLELMNSSDGKDLFNKTVAEHLKEKSVTQSHDGKSANWGPFHIQLESKTYTFQVGPNDPTVKACTFFYKGEFEFQAGKWVAATPRETGSALGGGRD